ncbi:hypothetical protein IQ26_06942 [Mesorhizobium tianshanense]|uniref:Uncharacterized protein n=1 Tax=Mesorhizobium tianshanense TaxID=39844 RepID=A0A562MLI7_9HYPH|nr:hypothetical protein IQ26_06942 [Mesorhizobium tianshanense]
MSFATQYLQTGVHRYLPFLGLPVKITAQNSSRVIDIEHDTL